MGVVAEGAGEAAAGGGVRRNVDGKTIRVSIHTIGFAT